MTSEAENEPAGDAHEKGVADSLEKVLNLNGFSFQYAVVKRAEDLRGKGEAHWWLEGTEIPVGSGADYTHIDIVFEPIHRYQQETKRDFVIAECKRVDPAKSIWCFAKSPYSWRHSTRTRDATQLDKVNLWPDSEGYTASTSINYSNRGTYEMGFEIKTSQKGDGIGTHHKSAIDAAVAQVMRGVKGFINYLVALQEDSNRRKLLQENTFVPVIFTTAELYTTNSNIALADLAKGRLPQGSIEAEKATWIWFNHNRSVNLSHSVPINHNANEDYDRYFRDFSRSIAIVGPDGIDEFLKSSLRDWFW